MKAINVYLEDAEHEEHARRKGKLSWKEYLLRQKE